MVKLKVNYLNTANFGGKGKLKKVIKNGLKQLIKLSVALLGKTSIGRYLYGEVVNNAMGRTHTVAHHGVNLLFSVPNGMNEYRFDTFSTKEPNTLVWIEGMSKGSVVWDIGANVGLYACYAAKLRGCRVFAFEPSVFNLELLARNIFLNGLTDLVTIVPLPLTEALAVSKMNMTTTEWGGALSTFDKSYGHDGKPLCKTFEFSTVGLSMTEAVELLGIPRPNHIKLDVDGLEHLILKGGTDVLLHVESVLIEINGDFQEQAAGSKRYLSAAGLQLTEMCRDRATELTSLESNNQIWQR